MAHGQTGEGGKVAPGWDSADIGTLLDTIEGGVICKIGLGVGGGGAEVEGA